LMANANARLKKHAEDPQASFRFGSEA
jgi:hypothetical protein